jgi:UDP-galactopyranose mutase
VTQKEAVTFYDDNTLVFTDEEFKGLVGGNVYEVKLDQVKRNVIKYGSDIRHTQQTKQ